MAERRAAAASPRATAAACVAAVAAIATAVPVPAKGAPKADVKREHWSCPYGETLPVDRRDDRLVAIPVALHALPNGGAAMTGRLVVRVPCIESRYEKHVPVAFTVEHGALRLCTDLYGLPAVPGEVATDYSIREGESMPPRVRPHPEPACGIRIEDVYGWCEGSTCSYRLKVHVGPSSLHLMGRAGGLPYVPKQKLRFRLRFERPHKLPRGKKGYVREIWE